MRHQATTWFCFAIAICLLAAGCSRGGLAGQEDTATQLVASQATETPAPTTTRTPTLYPTYTPAPTRRPPEALIPTDTPTPALPVTAGQPFPFPMAPINSETVGQLLALAEYGEPAIWEVHLSADGSRMAIVTPAEIDIYDAMTRRLLSQIDIHVLHGEGQAVTISANGSRLVALAGEQVQVLSSQGDPLQILPAQASYVYQSTVRLAPASFSSDGKQVAVLACTGELPKCQVEVRDVTDNRLAYAVAAQPDGNPPAFSLDGSLFGYQAEGSLWIVHTGDWKFVRRIFLGDDARWVFSPDGSLLGIAHVNRVEIYDTARHNLLTTLRDFARSGTGIPQVRFSEHSKAVLVLDAEKTLHVWSLPKSKRISQQQSRYASLSLYRLMDSGELIALSMPSRPQVVLSEAPQSFAFSTQGDALLYTQQGEAGAAENRKYCRIPLGGNPACMGMPGSRLTDALGNLYRWEEASDGHVLSNATGDPMLVIPRNGRAITPLWVSVPGGVLAYQYTDSFRPNAQQFAIQPFSSGAPEILFDRLPEKVAISAGGESLVIAILQRHGWRTTRDVLVINARTGEVIYQEQASDPVEAMSLSPGSRWLATGSVREEDGSARLGLIDLASGSRREISLAGIDSTGGRIAAIQFSWDERLIAVGFTDGSLAVVDVDLGAVLHQWKAHGDTITGLAFSQDGMMLATSSLDGMIQVWGVKPW